MNFFDSHAHLTDEAAYSNLDEVIKRARDANISKIINVCIDQISFEKGLEISNKYDFIFNAAATIPQDVNKNNKFYSTVEEAAKNKKIVAIGETGLDYFYASSHKDMQKTTLRQYLQLAKKYNLPVIFHIRDAFSDLFQIADEEHQNSNAVVHCFTGTEKEAKEALDRGWLISFSGIVTYTNSEDLRRIVQFVPLDKILVETDSPLLAPQSKRGKKNEPAFLVEIAQVIAKLKNKSLEDIANITSNNASSFFFKLK